MFGIYKERNGRLLTGVLAGIARRFSWDVWKVRAVFFVLCLLGRLGLLFVATYVLAAAFLPDREVVEAERFGTGPRKIKTAQKIHKGFWRK